MEFEDRLRRAAAKAKEYLTDIPIPDTPRPARRRRHLLSAKAIMALAGATTLVIIGGLTLLIGGGGAETPPREATSGAAVPPATTSTFTTLSTETDMTTTTQVPQPEPVPLPPLGNLGETLVFLSTDTHLTVVNVDSNEVSVHELPELAGGDPIYRLVSSGASIVFYGQTDSGPAVFSLNPRTSMSPVLVSEGWFFVPSAHKDRVWVATLDPKSPETVRALSWVQEVTLDGTVTTGPVKPPSGRWPLAAVTNGLLFQTETSLELWDPITEEFVATLPGPFPVATWRNRVATCIECAGLEGDELHIYDLDVGSDTTITAPEGIVAFEVRGAFSEDGRYIAVIGRETPGPVTEQTQYDLVLIDVEAGSSTIVANSKTTGWDYPQVGWSTTSDKFFFYNNSQLMTYMPGDTTAQIVPVDLEGPYYGMSTP